MVEELCYNEEGTRGGSLVLTGISGLLVTTRAFWDQNETEGIGILFSIMKGNY